MRKFVLVTLAFAIFMPTFFVFAKEKITVNIDGITQEFEAEPIMENNRVLVPFRKIFEEFGCSVSYTEISGKKFVNASRGENIITFEIGTDNMFINDDKKVLDAGAKIVDGRAFVPLRAISESLNANVEWIKETNTVYIYKKKGLHNINSEVFEKTIKDERGNVLIYINGIYPVIENPKENVYIEKINNVYEKYSEEFISKAEKHIQDAKEIFAKDGERFAPFEFNLSYEINADRKDILSITNYMFYDLKGVHPSTERQSMTFDLKNEKELELSDIIIGNEKKRLEIINNAFADYLKSGEAELFEETSERIKKEAKNVKFYMTDKALKLYFDVYQVGSYAMQYPTAEIGYSKDIFKFDWSDFELDILEINLEGNPSTGYEWEALEYDAERINIVKKYIQNENSKNLVGVGGTYEFEIGGLKEGNCSVDLVYMRSWEDIDKAIEAYRYSLYISNDKKITVLGVENIR